MMLMALMKAVYTSLNREQRQVPGQETVSFTKTLCIAPCCCA